MKMMDESSSIQATESIESSERGKAVKKYVVTWVIYGGMVDDCAHALGIYDTKEAAMKALVQDMLEYADTDVGSRLDLKRLCVWNSDEDPKGSDFCAWNIDEVAA